MTEQVDLVVREAEVGGELVDVAVHGTAVRAVGPRLATTGAVELFAGGGVLVPGLHDHHLHLLATAALVRSVDVGPEAVGDVRAFQAALRRAAVAAPDGWVRAVGYHESVAGDLDRDALDAAVADRPVRVQHRTGARWVLNTAAIEALDLDHVARHGIERDADGRPTGRIDRGDDWLRDLLPRPADTDLAAVGADLSRYGVTAVTDATPYRTTADLEPLAEAVRAGDLPQRVLVTGGPELAAEAPPPGLEVGPVKVVLDDHDLPALADLAGWIADAHRLRGTVAIHCVTRVSLVLALAAWDEVGAAPGDRVEHGAVVPAELVPALRAHSLTVVTQPGFVAERGDAYLRDVDPDDRAHLYRCRSLVDAGVAVAGSTDAPYSHLDPWRAVRAARDRRTRAGATLGGDERLEARRALELFLGPADRPGGPPRRVAPGADAGLCLLSVPLAEALADPSSDTVAATIRDGRLLYARDANT